MYRRRLVEYFLHSDGVHRDHPEVDGRDVVVGLDPAYEHTDTGPRRVRLGYMVRTQTGNTATFTWHPA